MGPPLLAEAAPFAFKVTAFSGLRLCDGVDIAGGSGALAWGRWAGAVRAFTPANKMPFAGDPYFHPSEQKCHSLGTPIRANIPHIAMKMSGVPAFGL